MCPRSSATLSFLDWMAWACWRRRIQSTGISAVILITGHGDVAMAVNAMRLGPYDFVEKPFPPDRLVEMASVLIEDALAEHHGNASLVCQIWGFPSGPFTTRCGSSAFRPASDAREAIVNAAAKSVGGRG
jgi:DNA-binding response OmpR family regulator